MATTSSKRRCVFDIETNGFMPEVNKIWMIVIQDVSSKEVFKFVSMGGMVTPSIRLALTMLESYDVIIGHNIIGYDLVVLEHLCDWKPLPTQSVCDTWILSQLVQYKRKHKHSIEGWGEKLGMPKVGLNMDFSVYSDMMLARCIKDVEINTIVYEDLMVTAKKMIQRNPLFLKGIDVEMEFAKLETEIRNKGWLFNLSAARELLTEIDGKLTHIEEALEPEIGMRCIKHDGLEAKQPAWRKDGCYTVNTVKWFGYDIESGKPGRNGRPIEGPYCRISFEQGKVSSIEVVKDYLYSLGWEPDEWNYDIIKGVPVKKSPKLTESSLFLLGERGVAISEYYTIRSRKGILEGWIKEVEKDGRLHGRMWTIGTPSFRCRHEVVANLPSVDAVYGKEMRSLFICEEGMSIVGADSAGNQMRGLCHYIGNDEFTNEVINGDVHQRNADVLGVSRKTAKPFLYAFLFGGGAGKLGLILTGKRDATVGATATAKFKDSIPGFKVLVESIESTFETTGMQFGKSDAFIKGIDGRLIFSDSKHKLLNYLLQTLEGITCKAAAVWMKRKLVELDIPHYFALHYHDEMAIVVPDDYAEQVRLLSIQAFTDAPKDFGVMCMNGGAHVGKNYAEVH